MREQITSHERHKDDEKHQENCEIDWGLFRKYAGIIVWNNQSRRWEL